VANPGSPHSIRLAMTAAERQLTEKELLEKGVYSSLQHRLRRHLLQQLLMLLVLPSLLRYLIRPVHIAAVLDNPHGIRLVTSVMHRMP
jgi:hypothetical protein